MVVGVGEEEGVDSLREVTSVYVESLLFGDESLSTFYLILPKNYKSRVQNVDKVSVYIVGSRRCDKEHELKIEDIDVCCRLEIIPATPLPKNLDILSRTLEFLLSERGEKSPLGGPEFKKGAFVSETIYKVAGENVPKKVRKAESYRGVVDENFAFGFKPEETRRYFIPVEELTMKTLEHYALGNKCYLLETDTPRVISIDGGGKYGWNMLRDMDINF